MPNIIPVDDPGDPRIEPYRNIRERDLVGRAGLFVAEGRVVIEKLVASTAHRIDTVLLASHRVEGLREVLNRLGGETPVFSASQRVIDAVAGFPLHRGFLAIGRRLDPPGVEDLLASLPARAIVLALFGIANHDNMGGIFRNAAAFGVSAILLDAKCCDPLYRKAIRVSVGAALLVPYARMPHGTDVLKLLARHHFDAIALSPRGGIPLAELTTGARSAVLLGAEGPGLAKDIMARATDIRIPMADGFDSLNVATTSGIVLHHLACAPPLLRG